MTDKEIIMLWNRPGLGAVRSYSDGTIGIKLEKFDITTRESGILRRWLSYAESDIYDHQQEQEK